MANEIAKKDAAPVAAANTERPNTENKVKVKKNTKADIIMARLDDTSPDGILAMVTDMTGDKDFGKKFVTYAKLQIKNGWKQDKATGKWTNSFNLVPVESVLWRVRGARCFPMATMRISPSMRGAIPVVSCSLTTRG